MASAATARGVLCRLRRDIARIEGRLAAADRLGFVGENPDSAARAIKGVGCSLEPSSSFPATAAGLARFEPASCPWQSLGDV